MNDYDRETLLAYEHGATASNNWTYAIDPKRLTLLRRFVETGMLHNPLNQFIVYHWDEYMILTKKGRAELGLDVVKSDTRQRGLFDE